MNPLYQFAQFVTDLELRFGAGWLFIFKIVIFFLTMALLFLVTTVFSRIGKLRDNQIKIKHQTIFQNFLLDFLYQEQNAGDSYLNAPEIGFIKRKYLINHFNRQLLVDEIVNLHKGLSGDTAIRLRTLFGHFELDHFCMAKLKSRSWQIKAAGINELREMRINAAKESIERLVNHPEQNVRSNAQIALLELDQSDSRLSFFQNLSFGLTEWDQLRLYESLKARSGQNVKSFKPLFQSTNTDIVYFGIRMANYFGSTSDIAFLYAFLNHEKIEIRSETIITLTKLGDFESHVQLTDRYWDEKPSIQLLILKYLEQAQRLNMELLRHAIFAEDFSLSLESAYQIKKHFPGQIADIVKQIPVNHPVRNHFAHVSEPRISRK